MNMGIFLLVVAFGFLHEWLTVFRAVSLTFFVKFFSLAFYLLDATVNAIARI